MSKYEWEEGCIALPTAEVPRLRKALNAAQAKYVAEQKRQLERVWPKLKNVAPDKRTEALWKMFIDRQAPSNGELQAILSASKGRKPTAEHWGQIGLGPCTNRTKSWYCGDAEARLDGRELLWSVCENNHAVDHAHESWLGEALFAHLRTVKWTRGSGGDIVGNDEYNRESTFAGGGANYVTASYGPKASCEHRCDPSPVRGGGGFGLYGRW
ncbi:hypothetical protein [Dietzia sp. 179-F 9C3 NHS]|uniref:hypothetical protein n=1 Tax=Dietzia sp. 179-F 9C3 NHS TaxID=3374295 RepID=UPI003879276E